MEYPNFFESQKESSIRLHGTVVLYDNEPVEVVHTTDHLGDKVIYAFIRPIGLTASERAARPEPAGLFNLPHVAVKDQGQYLDAFIKDNPSSQLKRVPLSDYGFNKFRPFELGMYWESVSVLYVERQPNRKTEQGLTTTMLVSYKLDLTDERRVLQPVDIFGPEMYRCIKGLHPSPTRCIEGLTGGKYVNQAAAFHRHFAFLLGPADTLFLVYKNTVIGVLPHGDFSQVRLSRDFAYTKEVVDELHLFGDIRY